MENIIERKVIERKADNIVKIAMSFWGTQQDFIWTFDNEKAF
jgi:hypothetical protein